MKRSIILFALLTFFGNVRSVAQDPPTVDIGMVALESGQFQIVLIPDGPFNQLLSQIQFTLRWSSSSSATLSEFMYSPLFAQLGISLGASPTVQSGGYNYATFVGLGFTQLVTNGQSWSAGVPYVLGNIDVINGPTDLLLVDDQWTAANNTDYYISLNGQNSTGDIVELSTTIRSETSTEAFSLRPNPSSGLGTLDLQLDHTGPVVVQVLDATGKIVEQHGMTANAGPFRLQIGSEAIVEGAYLVRIEGPGIRSTIPWMVVR